MAAAIELLILDINDVVYRYDTLRRIELLADLTSTTPDAVRMAVFASGIEDRSDRGELSADDYLVAIGHRLGRAVDRATWTRSLAGAVIPMPDSIELVRRVSARIATVGLSNNGMIVKEQAHRIFPLLTELGIDLYVSAEFGGQKPEADVYLGLCRHLDVEP